MPNAETSPLGICAGHCTLCGKLIWRTAELQREAWGLKPGHTFLLWPEPASLYAVLAVPTGFAPGIAYCRGCAPPLLSPGPALDGAPIQLYETAYDRYTDWYTDRRGEFWRAWLADALYLEDAAIKRLMTIWEMDRRECDRLRDADSGAAAVLDSR
jgi:hypothetical protein